MTHVDKRRDLANANYKEVHDIIFPADVRTSDAISAKVKLRDDSGDFESLRLWKISPLGIEVVLPDFVELPQGALVDLKLQVGPQSTTFEGSVVGLLSDSASPRIAGIRLTGKKAKRTGTVDRRKSTRWNCSSQFYPVAICPNPVEFNDFIYFRIKDISESGIRAITSLRNKFVVPGMKLSLQISFPLIGHANIETIVSRANLTSEDGKDYLELGLNIDQLTNRDREIVGQYLIQFSDADSLDAVRSEGLYPKSLVAGLDYSFVKTEEDFAEALKVRLRANQEAQKISAQSKPSDMSDLFDARSRILIWRYKSESVGTIRVTFCDSDSQLEIEKYVKLPKEFPRRDEIAEAGRAATAPEYRKGDLFFSMLQRAAIVCLQAGRPFVIMSTTKELVSMYERIGFTKANLEFIHDLYPSQTQIVLSIDLRQALAGKNVGLLAWNTIWKDVLEHLSESGAIDVKPILTSKTKAYKLLSPLAALPKYFMSRPRKRQKESRIDQ